jgi:menaquinone-dependent protoporphyrinogen IX oxidase
VRALVVFFSRTGRTRKAARALAGLLGAETEELVERGVERGGVMGYLRSGRDAMKKRPVELEPLQHAAAGYDLVVLGSPVWAFTLCPAIRSFLESHGGEIRKAAFLSTHGGGGPSKSYAEAEALLGKPLAATLALKDRIIDAGEAEADLAAFAKRLAAG